MILPFVNRSRELGRLRRLIGARHPGFAVVYGRRRLGKSRLVQRALEGHRAAYYVGDERDAPLQREALAREIVGLLPGFATVSYPDWHALFSRFFSEAPAGATLALDELPSLVRQSPELPSVLQKLLDGRQRPIHLIVSGSSQRMMHGLALDGAAPLYGRAQEILKVAPLEPGWLEHGLKPRSPADAVAAWAAFGGVPRYWELARGKGPALTALGALAFDTLGPLYFEPERLLADELDDIVRASSILSLVASGAHRVSEIAGRLALPATSLSRPLARLVDLGLLSREVPFGDSPRDAKRSLYRVADPFLRTWYRFVEPNRSKIERGDRAPVDHDVRARWPHHLAEAWETLVREVPLDEQWTTGDRWWGKDAQGQLELDLIARAAGDEKHVLVGEVKLRLKDGEVARELAALEKKIERCPALKGLTVDRKLFVLEGPRAGKDVVTGAQWWAAAKERRQ